MSVTAEPALAAAPGWNVGRARRIRMMAGLAAVTVLIALYAATQAWFATATSGQASCTPAAIPSYVTLRTPDSNTAVGHVYSSGCATGRDIATQYSDADLDPRVAMALARLDPENTAKPTASILGMPRPVPLLVLFVGIGIFGLISRNGVVGLVSVVGLYYVHADLGAFAATMGAGEGGALAHSQPGFELFGWAFVFSWGLVSLGTLFVARHNAGERTMVRRAALAAGKEPPPSLLDRALMGLGGKLGVAFDAAQRERTKAAAAD